MDLIIHDMDMPFFLLYMYGVCMHVRVDLCASSSATFLLPRQTIGTKVSKRVHVLIRQSPNGNQLCIYYRPMTL